MARPDDTTDPALAYVYGELSPEAHKAFEARLASDPSLRADVEGLKATRELLGDDAAWGQQSGTDAPPPQLVDAILRAEALTRAPAVRDAAVQKSSPARNPAARLLQFLVGGGALVGATAAVFLVVGRANDPEAVVAQKNAPQKNAAPTATEQVFAPDAAPAAAAFDDGEAQGGALPPPAPPAGQRQAPAEDPRLDAALRGADGDSLGGLAASDERAARSKADRLAGVDDSGGGAGLERREKSAEPSPPREEDQAPPETRKGSLDDRAASPVVAPVTPAPADKKAEAPERKVAKDARAPASSSLNFQEGGLGQGNADLGAARRSDEKPKAEPARERLEVAETASRDAYDDDSAPAADAPAASVAPAPGRGSAAAAASGATSSAGPIIGKPLTPAEAAKQRAREANKKAEPQKEQAKSAPSKAKKSAAPAPAEPPPPPRGDSVRRAQEAEQTLMSAAYELEGGRAPSALLLFERAQQLDTKGELGAGPLMGQLRALQAMKRDRDVVLRAQVLLKKDPKDPVVQEALIIAAEAAERVKDFARAESFYQRLYVSPAYAKRARARVKDLSSDRVEAESAADDVPAAAAPPEAK